MSMFSEIELDQREVMEQLAYEQTVIEQDPEYINWLIDIAKEGDSERYETDRQYSL